MCKENPMRTSILLSLLAFSAVASAESLDLYTTTGWGALHQYHDVGNSAGVPLAIYIGVSGSASVYLADDVYTGFYNGSGVASTFANEAGVQITLTLSETSRRVCVRQGRGQSCHLVWTLVEGTLVR
jgi:hypothetical protein